MFYFNRNWHSVGGRQKSTGSLLASGSRIVCFAAADDWLNEHETEETAHKTREWLREPPTSKQISTLPTESRLDFNLTRYRASARITFEMNKNKIRELILEQRDEDKAFNGHRLHGNPRIRWHCNFQGFQISCHQHAPA